MRASGSSAPLRRPYEGQAGHTGVRSYALVKDGIIIEFVDGRRYLYTMARPGPRHVHQMVRLAQKGLGLTTYINQHVRGNYASRLDR